MDIELIKPILEPGDELISLTYEGARHFPEGSILEAISDNAACLAYKAATAKWTITGLDYVATNAELSTFNVGWRVVRWGYQV